MGNHGDYSTAGGNAWNYSPNEFPIGLRHGVLKLNIGCKNESTCSCQITAVEAGKLGFESTFFEVSNILS